MRLRVVPSAWFHRRDPIDALIAAKGARPRFTGFDPELRDRTAVRREEAERLARASRRVASSPLTDRRLRRIQ